MAYLKAIHRRLLPADADLGWLPYLWLAYLVFFFLRYVNVDVDAAETVAVLLTMVAFFVLYFNGFWRRGWRLVPTIAGLSILGSIWAPVNIGSSVFFIFACSFAGWLGPVQRATLGIAAVLGWAAVVAFLWQPNPVFWATTLVFGAVVGTVCAFNASRVRRAAMLRLSQEEVRQMAQVAERERISRDMHDLLGHTLSVITLKAELAARLVDLDPVRASAEMREVEQVSRAALAEVREAISGIRARGLLGELGFARIALKAAGVNLTVEGAPPTMPPANEAVLALVVREAVTNVIRHAQASRCRIEIRREAGETFVEIHDDGRGGKAVAGGGIDGMRARLAAAGGRLEVGDEFGVRLRAWLPS